jgi:hypothetical protein
VTKPYNAREVVHGLAFCLCYGDEHARSCDDVTAALNRAYVAGMERAAEIARERTCGLPVCQDSSGRCAVLKNCASAIDEEARKGT